MSENPKSGAYRTARSAGNGQFVSARPGKTVMREVLGPDGKVRVRIDRDVIANAIRESGSKK